MRIGVAARVADDHGGQSLRHGSLAFHGGRHSVTYREQLYSARTYAAAQFLGMRRITRGQSRLGPTHTTLN
jgi:hypothetical protein